MPNMVKETKKVPVENRKSCWNCSYQQIGGDTFLGKCTWFSKHKQEPDKDIPPDRVDVGCDYFVKRRYQ